MVEPPRNRFARGAYGSRAHIAVSRRWFMTAAPLAVLSASRAAAQHVERRITIGTLDTGFGDGRRALWAAFQTGLRDTAHREPREFVYERRWADGDEKRLPRLASDLVRAHVDIIVAAGTHAALAAVRATTTIPIVFVIVASDPVSAGLVASFARPGGNATGGTSISADLSAKRLGLLKEAVPGLQRVGIVWDTTSQAARTAVQEMQTAARTLKLEVSVYGVGDVKDFGKAFGTAKTARVDGVSVASGAMFFSARRQLADAALQQRLPTIFSASEYAEAGGLLAYGADLKEGFRRGAVYVARILDGALPGSLPVERPTKFELVVNARTARALALPIPSSLLLRADHTLD